MKVFRLIIDAQGRPRAGLVANEAPFYATSVLIQTSACSWENSPAPTAPFTDIPACFSRLRLPRHLGSAPQGDVPSWQLPLGSGLTCVCWGHRLFSPTREACVVLGLGRVGCWDNMVYSLTFFVCFNIRGHFPTFRWSVLSLCAHLLQK